MAEYPQKSFICCDRFCKNDIREKRKDIFYLATFLYINEVRWVMNEEDVEWEAKKKNTEGGSQSMESWRLNKFHLVRTHFGWPLVWMYARQRPRRRGKLNF